MALIKQKEYSTDLRLTAIDIIESSFNIPEVDSDPYTTFNYKADIETRFDPAKNTILVVLKIQVLTGDQKILSTIKTGCQYIISNFHQIIKIKSGGEPVIPAPLFETLVSISISTTRGILYSQFKGTFLHNAILPVFDVKAFVREGK